MTQFRQLNDGWNAQPNAPQPAIMIDGPDVVLSFSMNSYQFPAFQDDNIGVLRFARCVRYRLGPTNDEGWYQGQCRFSKIAPQWGEFYQIIGDLRLEDCPNDWIKLRSDESGSRHFLFYFRDETFECDAADWEFRHMKAEQGRLVSTANMPAESWPIYWSADLNYERRRSLEAELRRELPIEHVLCGQSATAKAIGNDPDDVVFQLRDGRYAVVHLTWREETDCRFPFTLMFDDLDSLARCNEWT